MKTCSVADCETKTRAMGMCNKHYQKNAKYGDPLATAVKPLEVRFWPMVEKTDTCWNWTGTKYQGYGQIYSHQRGGAIRAHRASYEMHVGPIPDGMVIDHMCHNPSCVNPDHLRIATQKQNMENREGAQYNSQTGVRGVNPYPSRNKFRALVGDNRKNIFVGYFDSIAEAEAAVVARRIEVMTHNLKDRIAS